jgi:hypothetical protein
MNINSKFVKGFEFVENINYTAVICGKWNIKGYDMKTFAAIHL